MWIYKITNDINDKVYIGQTSRGAEGRFKRHIQDAMSKRLDTHLSRAIRKYGPEHFSVETIDSANSQCELNQKEHYWINFYNAVKDGYNETDSMVKCGGNTYLSKTEEEMDIIRQKIRETKMGGKNPNARKLKMINVLTGEVTIFDCIVDCARYFGKEIKNCIYARIQGKITAPYDGKYMFEYYNE